MIVVLAALFWVGMFVVFYTYLGYGLLVFALVQLRGKRPPQTVANADLPGVTVVIAAYNEADIIEAKLANTLALDYPRALLHVLFVTDGSSDGTDAIVCAHAVGADCDVRVTHQAERQGKLAALTRAMPQVTTPITIFTDANAMLNAQAVRCIVAYYADPAIGAVSGEKRVGVAAGTGAEALGEGAYWRYESTLKRLDAELYSVVGAAGELFSIRTTLYEAAPVGMVLDDFYLSLHIAMRGYRVAYAPDAYAMEGPSASLKEEIKRKVRIASGGLQFIIRTPELLNPLRHGLLSFQYISHRVLRWTLTPLLLPVLLLLNAALAWHGLPFYMVTLGLQLGFYAAALLGWLVDQLGVKVKLLYIPFYFCLMNYAVYAGALRLLRGRQSAAWEKARRA